MGETITGGGVGAKTGHEKAVETLNKLLSGELAAVETYQQAIERLGEDFPTNQQLESCLNSHQHRAQQLTDRVSAMGGKPAETAGPWGEFARLVEEGAKLFGPQAALASLEEGEDHGLQLYQAELEHLSGELRAFVESQLLSQQQRTHAALSALKQIFH